MNSAQRDQLRYAQFCRRSASFFKYLSYTHLILIVCYALVDASLEFTSLNAVLSLAALASIFLIHDPLEYFLATHPTWLFSFATYVYSAFNLKPLEPGLFGPLQSLLVAVNYQIAVYCAFWSVRWLSRISFRSMSNDINVQRVTLKRRTTSITDLTPFRIPMAWLGFSAVLLATRVESSTANAIAGQAQFLIWMGAVLHVLRNERLKSDLFMIAFASSFVILTLISNFRSLLFSCILFFLVCFFYFGGRVKFITVGVALLGLNFLSIFSAISLDIRMHGGRVSETSLISQYSEKIMTYDTLLAVVNPFYGGATQSDFRNSQKTAAGQAAFEIPFYLESPTLGQRFVILPMMDVICGDYGEVAEIRWDKLTNLVLSALPNFGQEKVFWYSDLITWERGLRAWGNVGAPMITNACELYTLGGWRVEFTIAYLEFMLIFVWCRIIRRVLEFQIIGISILAQMFVYVTLTTTSLSVITVALRGLPMTIIFFWLAKYFARKFYRRRNLLVISVGK